MIRLFSRSFSYLNVTSQCAARIKKICKANEFMRILVDGGEGCGGFVYKFNIESEMKDNDYVIESEGAKIVVDQDSIALIKGSTVDFTDEMIKKVFTVKENPQADMTCGCGSSFSPKFK
ncbi:unnamed protein product [Blepharisma stoltei]|uniref:Core domain-containing protein n=1 Tax=Blepharisma stoltei TaxID=1481888 RepID=A0AAU9JZK6_9CILI|nr:unnamed protein product [Blepharisma stoltei]